VLYRMAKLPMTLTDPLTTPNRHNFYILRCLTYHCSR